jgi:hypothetical protein
MPGFTKQAECVSAEEMRVSAGELKFSWPKKQAFEHSEIQY